MKYLKNFENNNKYEIGDYILLNMNILKKSKFFKSYNITDDMAKITAITKNTDTQQIEYYIIFTTGYNENCTFLLKNEISRKLTPFEIEIFKIKKDTNKYNL